MSEYFEDEEDYFDEEYINRENDPDEVEEFDEDFTVVEDEEEIGFDKVFEIVRAKSTTLTNYDHMMEEKVLDTLRRGNSNE